LQRDGEILEREREELERDREQLEAERARVREEWARLEEIRALLEADKAAAEEAGSGEVVGDGAPSESAKTAVSVALTDILEERGLIGVDEFERALGGMARARVLREVLSTLSVHDPAELRRRLAQRLRLVGGEPFPFLEPFFGMVTVSDDRAELDGQARVRAAVEALGESLLLNGISMMTVVGDRPVVFRCVQEYLDERIELRASANLSAADVSLAARSRATLVWGVPVADSVRAAASSSGHRLYSDPKPRRVVEHCKRTRSWLAE
jgi:hypothetical protein